MCTDNGNMGSGREQDRKELGFFSLNWKAWNHWDKSRWIDSSKNAGWTNYPKGVMWAFEKEILWTDTRNGYPDLWKYSEWFWTFFFRITGSADRTDVKRYIWIWRSPWLILHWSDSIRRIISMDATVGIMDQFASAMGKKDHAIFLDTNTLKYEYAPVVLENAKIVIINSR